MAAVEHVLQYLRAIWEEFMTYCGLPKPNELRGCVDADWVGDTDTKQKMST